MKLGKKLFILLLSMLMVIGLSTMTALAAGTEVNDFSELTTAIADGAEIKLMANINATSAITIPMDATVTLDLNGKTLSGSLGAHMIVNNGTLIIKDTSLAGDGAIEKGNDSTHYLINNIGTLKIENGSFSSVSTVSTLIRTDFGAITTIEYGTFTSVFICLKVEETGTLTINGGDFTASGDGSSVVQNWGTTTITDGTFEATGTNGAAIYAASWGTYASTTTIINGTFTGHYAIFIDIEEDVDDDSIVTTVTVLDGTFSGKIDGGKKGHGFVAFDIPDDLYSFAVEFQHDDGNKTLKFYTDDDEDALFPTDTQAGKVFDGWEFAGFTLTDPQTELTAALLADLKAAYAPGTPIVATPKYRAANINGQDMLTYPEIGVLDRYGILGVSGHEIQYDKFSVNGTALTESDFAGLSISRGIKSGSFGNRNQFVFANMDEGTITLTVRILRASITGAGSSGNIEFTLDIGEIKNSTIENIAYTGDSGFTMDAFGFTADSITLSPNDFTIEINSVPTNLGAFLDSYPDVSISMEKVGQNFSAPTANSDGSYTFTVPNNASNSDVNGSDAAIKVKVTFPKVNNSNVVVTSNDIVVAKVYYPVMTATGTTKELTLQKSGAPSEHLVDLGPGASTNDWSADFPDFELTYNVNGVEGVVDNPELSFGLLRVLESGAIRELGRTGGTFDLTDPSTECVDLWHSGGLPTYEPQKIIANAETGTIDLILQNVRLMGRGVNNTSLPLTGTIANQGALHVTFIYEVTLIPTFTVTFDSNGGSAVADVQNIGGGEVTLPTPTRSGYTFDGWNDPQGNEVASPYTPDSDITLTAQWTYNGGGYIPPTTPTTPTVPVTQQDPEPIAQRPFDDVYVDDWYDGDATYVWENGLMIGTERRIFSPNMNTSRAMIATIMHRMAGTPAGGTETFSDVENGMWYSAAIAWGQTNGIIEGWNGAYRPNDNITRQELAAILSRYAKYIGAPLPTTRALPSFADEANISGYAKDAVNELYQAGVINGRDNNRFDPNAYATRAEVAAMIHRFAELVK